MLRDAQEANLPSVYLKLSDDETLRKLLEEARTSDALGGELTALAKNILSIWEETPKIAESFREGRFAGTRDLRPELAGSANRLPFEL